MAKEKYIAPDMEMIEFEHEDVIVTSDTTPFVPKSALSYDPNKRMWVTNEDDG